MGSFRSTLVVGSALCMLVAGAGSALAGGNPPGNNGTVKFDGMPFERPKRTSRTSGAPSRSTSSGSIRARSPGRRRSSSSRRPGTASCWSTPPSSAATRPVAVPISTGPSYEDLSAAIASSGATAQPNQGFHVRLTVEAQGSIGAMTKHKTFWVTDCNGGGEGGGEGGRRKLSPVPSRSQRRAWSLANLSEQSSSSAGDGRVGDAGSRGCVRRCWSRRRVVDRPRRGSGPATPAAPRILTPSRTGSR